MNKLAAPPGFCETSKHFGSCSVPVAAPPISLNPPQAQQTRAYYGVRSQSYTCYETLLDEDYGGPKVASL